MVDPGELSREELVALAVAQAEEITVLRAANAELAARLERLVSRNSGNSSMPPSKDGEPGKTAPDAPGQRGGREGRKRGKQPGAEGASLGWREDPDDRVDRFPEGRCECGAELAGAADLGVSDRYQQTEIPLVSATTIQYEQHAVRCGCGKVHTASRPEGAGAGRVGYGPLCRYRHNGPYADLRIMPTWQRMLTVVLLRRAEEGDRLGIIRARVASTSSLAS